MQKHKQRRKANTADTRGRSCSEVATSTGHSKGSRLTAEEDTLATSLLRQTVDGSSGERNNRAASPCALI
jgi:hypothetical protein